MVTFPDDPTATRTRLQLDPRFEPRGASASSRMAIRLHPEALRTRWYLKYVEPDGDSTHYEFTFENIMVNEDIRRRDASSIELPDGRRGAGRSSWVAAKASVPMSQGTGARRAPLHQNQPCLDVGAAGGGRGCYNQLLDLRDVPVTLKS